MLLRVLCALFATSLLLAGFNSRLFALPAWLQTQPVQSAANLSESHQKTPTSGTAAFVFQGNRMFAELGFVRPDGTLHKAYAFVDLGSPSAVMSPALFKS